MYTITVINLHAQQHRLLEPETVYCGRTFLSKVGGGWIKGSPLANNFAIGRDGERTEVLQRYDSWLDAQLRSESATAAAHELTRLFSKLLELLQLNLACWCAPLDCHCDRIRLELLLRLKQLKEEE